MLTAPTRGKKMEEVGPFRIFNPESMAKPTAGYSQIAEVNDGKIIYIAGGEGAKIGFTRGARSTDTADLAVIQGDDMTASLAGKPTGPGC